MKKLLIWLFCVALLVSVTACGDQSGADQSEATTTTTSPSETESTEPTGEDATTTPSASATTTTTTTKKGDSTTTQKPTDTKVPQASDNIVDWDKFFGDDTPTTKKGDTTTTTTTKNPTTTTTKKPTTTTTLKPTTIDKVTLPAVGTDVDGKGRIAVSKVELSKGVLTLKLRNNTDKQTQKWITQETDYVTYACYDKNGKELKGKDEVFGYFYIGCLEVGEELEFKVTLPEGTAQVKITGAKIVYWTPWS